MQILIVGDIVHVRTLFREMLEPICEHALVYDAHGSVVSDLENGMRAAADHRSMFDARSLPSGMYFCRLEANGRLLIRTMMLVK